MKQPLNDRQVSVIMAMRNEEAHVAAAIESVLQQTHEDLELIIIDDYSTDRSAAVCRGFRDPRVRLHQKEHEPPGAAASRNLGVRLATGRFVAIHDADDVSAPARIEKQLAKALEAPDRRVVGCLARRVENEQERIVQMPEHHAQIIEGFHRTRNRSTIIAGTILAPRRLLLEIPYREQFKLFEDWDLLMRLYESGKVEFYNVQEPLYTYHILAKGVLFRPEYAYYNTYERHCRARRARHLPEMKDLEAFLEHLRWHPIEAMRWHSLRYLISLQLLFKGLIKSRFAQYEHHHRQRR